VAAGEYPPTRHFLSDLGLEAEIHSLTSATVRIRATPHILGVDGGVRAGVLATLVDVVGGSAALRALHPDWMATADLTLQIVRPVTGPLVEARATVLRQGRTTLVIEALVFTMAEDGGDPQGGPDAVGTGPAAWATLTFAILPGRSATSLGDVSPDLPAHWSFRGAGFDTPVADTLGISVTPDGVSMPVHDYLRNSFGAVQGGTLALLAEVAATEALAAARWTRGDRLVVTDLIVTYLALGRVGPIRSRTTVLDAGTGDGSGSAVVELVDAGAGDRPTTTVSVRAVPARVALGSGAR
jgi:uncharacterized protein (TIGR00369 family)